MDTYQPNRKRGGARERQEARNRRREPMVRPLTPSGDTPPPEAPSSQVEGTAPPLPNPTAQVDASAETTPLGAAPLGSSAATQRTRRVVEAGGDAARGAAQSAAKTAVNAARVIEKVEWGKMQQNASRRASRAVWVARDSAWHLRNNPRILFAIVGVIAVIFGGFVMYHVGGNRIFPNLSTVGISLGGMSADEAAAALQRHWAQDVQIELVDGERSWTVTTGELGIRIDTLATVESLKAAGMSGLPFGNNVYATLNLDLLATQNKLLDISEAARIQPYNAGYAWQEDVLVGINGTDGRFLDVSATLDALSDNLKIVSETRRLELIMTSVAPDVRNPEPYLDEVEALASQNFTLNGYDPFTNENFSWTTDRDTFTSWLEAGADSLNLRESAFAQFIDEKNSVLRADDSLRYLEPTETINLMRSAVQAQRSGVSLRVRYQPSTYQVVSGDSGHYIARKTGLPFNLIQQANPGRDWDAMLSPGELINLPTRDETLPTDVVPTKRIVIDIDRQYLVAFENEEVVFDWAISTGMSHAPTYPGVFQILSHVDLATGSSYELCSAVGCGTWDMYWFMGIYEVIPGLVNGFHGAVVLPNGSYLGGGNVGSPFTYGCVMSENGNAEVLYRWADTGTIVEIISRDYAPQSQLASSVRDGSWAQMSRVNPIQAVWYLNDMNLL